MKAERFFRDKARFNTPYLIKERKDTKHLKITEAGAMSSFDDDTATDPIHSPKGVEDSIQHNQQIAKWLPALKLMSVCAQLWIL